MSGRETVGRGADTDRLKDAGVCCHSSETTEGDPMKVRQSGKQRERRPFELQQLARRHRRDRAQTLEGWLLHTVDLERRSYFGGVSFDQL